MTPDFRFRWPVVAGAVALLLCARVGAFAQAAAYPGRPITMVVPCPPGGPTGLVGRVLAKKLGGRMGRNFVIDNRAGANGNIDATLVARAPGDGYTVLYNTSAIALPSLYKNVAYDVQRNFAPVVLVAVVPLALVTHPSIPANTVKEFVPTPGPTRASCRTAPRATAT